MPTRITIACTHCGAKLNLTDESKLGKKFKCPKCTEVFVAETAEEDDVLEMDDAGADEDEDDEEERPRSRRGAAASASAKGGKKGKAAKSGGNTGLIIGGIAGGVVLFGGLVGVLFATGVFGGTKADPNQIQVAPAGPGLFSSLLKEQLPPPAPARTPVPEVARWLPADTEFVIHARPADVLASPLISELLKSMQLDQQVNAAAAGLGFQLSDIESVTFGVAQLEKAQQQVQQAQMAMMMGGKPQFGGLNTPAIGVIKLKKSITYDDLAKLAAQLAGDQPVQKVSHAGKEFLEATDPKTSLKGGAYLASDSVVLMGDSTALKAAIDKGAIGKPLPNFGFIDWTDHLTIAFAPQKPGALKQQLSSGGQANPMMAMAMAPLAEGATGFSLGLTVKGGVEAEVAVGCLDAPKMDAIAKSLNDLSTFGRSQYDQNKGQLPPWASALTDMLMSNLKVTSSNRVVMLNTNIPDSAKDQLVQLPANIMMTMAMSGMMGGGPGQANGGGADLETPVSPGEFSSSFGEPTSVKASTIEGLPEGFQLTGSLQDGFVFEGAGNEDSKNKRKLNFVLQLEFSGPPEQCLVAAVGRPADGEATTANGESVKLLPESFQGFGTERSPYELYINPLGVSSVASGAGMYPLEVAKDETESFQLIKGSFPILTGSKSKMVEVADLRKQAGKESSDPDLKAAGLEIKLETRKDFGEEAEVAVISVKEGFLLSRIEAIDAQGESIFGFPETGPTERVQILRPEINQKKLKDGVGFRAYVYTDLKEVTVPFTFENVPLPKKQEK